MKNSIDDLRNHLFETIEALKDADNPMDIDRAKAVANVSEKILDSAKVELKFMELTDSAASAFLDADQRPQLPGSGPRAIGYK